MAALSHGIRDRCIGTAEGSVGDFSSSAAQQIPCWVADQAPRVRHIATGFDGARGMDILTFQQRVVEAYSGIFEQLETGAFVHPVRFWAFVPGIHDDLGAGLDRYMAFNAGRYGAFAAHLGRPRHSADRCRQPRRSESRATASCSTASPRTNPACRSKTRGRCPRITTPAASVRCRPASPARRCCADSATPCSRRGHREHHRRGVSSPRRSRGAGARDVPQSGERRRGGLRPHPARGREPGRDRVAADVVPGPARVLPDSAPNVDRRHRRRDVSRTAASSGCSCAVPPELLVEIEGLAFPRPRP